MKDARIFVCEESNSRVGLVVELANGCVAGAIDEPLPDMVEQIQMALQSDDTDEIFTAIEEAPVITREQFMEMVNRCHMLADFSQQCDDIPNLPIKVRDTPISYEEMEEEFWEINPELKEMLEQLLDQKTPVLEVEPPIPEVEVVEPDAIINNNGTIQLIESAIENFDPEEDNIEDNDVLFKLAQDNDNLHRKRVGLLPDPNLNYEIDEETHESLFGKLMRKLFRR